MNWTLYTFKMIGNFIWPTEKNYLEKKIPKENIHELVYNPESCVVLRTNCVHFLPCLPIHCFSLWIYLLQIKRALPMLWKIQSESHNLFSRSLEMKPWPLISFQYLKSCVHIKPCPGHVFSYSLTEGVFCLFFLIEIKLFWLYSTLFIILILVF